VSRFPAAGYPFPLGSSKTLLPDSFQKTDENKQLYAARQSFEQSEIRKQQLYADVKATIL